MRLFFSLFVLFFLGLSGLTAALVALGVHFFHFDSVAWTEVSSWHSRPVLVGSGLAAVSFLASMGLSLTWHLFAGVLGRMTAGVARKPSKAPRARSNRRTTV